MKKYSLPAAVLMGIGLIFCGLPLYVNYTGYVFLLLGAGIWLCGRWKRAPWRTALLYAMGLCVIFLTVCMAQVQLYGQWEQKGASGSCAVVLGAQTLADGRPSAILRERLERGLDFLEEDPEGLLVVSGGKGSDERKPEAQVMYDYLQSRGADMRRVLMEPDSSTTRENLRNTAALTGRTELVIITSEFHRFRADYIARSLGLRTRGISSATGDLFLRENYYLREVFAMVKAIVQAN